MENFRENRLCLDCGEAVKGRSDKKFCDDHCRNSYNNQLNSDATNLVRNINNILRRNRRILSDLVPDGKITVHREKLIARGFNFSYYTHVYTTQKGTKYYFCYELGYLPLDKDMYALVKRREE